MNGDDPQNRQDDTIDALEALAAGQGVESGQGAGAELTGGSSSGLVMLSEEDRDSAAAAHEFAAGLSADLDGTDGASAET